MRERLWEVAKLPLGPGVILFGKQPDIVSQCEKTFEEGPRVVVPTLQHVIVGNGIANGVFMVAVNRIGTEPPLTFYGSSFISDPYGRILAQAPRDEPAVLVADLDLDQRRDWLELFPFLTTRRPDAYASLAEEATKLQNE